MATEKMAMLVVFKMDKELSTDEWRERFNSGYNEVLTIPGLFFKNWWCNQQKSEWGAYYIFDSEKDLQAWITSDDWLKTVPEMYGGVKPEVTILEVGPIICIKEVNNAENSWIT